MFPGGLLSMYKVRASCKPCESHKSASLTQISKGMDSQIIAQHIETVSKVVLSKEKDVQSRGLLAFGEIKALFKPKKTDSYGWKFGKISPRGGCWCHVADVCVLSGFCRTRLANDAKSGSKGGERQFMALLTCTAKTLKSDGIAGLYRGFVISCVGIIVYRGFYFGLYDTLKPMLLGEDAGLLMSFVLGYGVTVSAGLASYPSTPSVDE
ncbi:hypothetical protein OS493_033586 [Desmophyllum pertusum]|uniref:ADP/ATP translocase n=1 Tax=Desmophyllum pertusum TaxID=174260 RepID=A0A9W9YVP7_9CNID|nr:hypothetical protein OS493_033586 [Desmophyllum pertusum]